MIRKLKSRKEIEKLVADLKKKGKKVVAINGSFDLLHVGHIRLLQEAKSQGDILIVGLNSDESVRNWKKHVGHKDWKKRPINPQRYRAEMLAALEDVDYITIFDELTGVEFVESTKPDVYVNGSEYGKDCVEAPIVKKHGGKVRIVKLFRGFSTSSLVKKIIDLYK